MKFRTVVFLLFFVVFEFVFVTEAQLFQTGVYRGKKVNTLTLQSDNNSNNISKRLMDCPMKPMNESLAARLAGIAIEGLTRPYPNIIHHVLNSDSEALTPRQLTPAFYGCFDWHSAVHTTWQLVRLIRTFPNAPYVPMARETLRSIITEENIKKESEYVRGDGRSGFERPYGLAWLLQLVAELEEWEDSEANIWRKTLVPLEEYSIESISTWLPKLTNPIRIGEHSQTAFSMGLVYDYAKTVSNESLQKLITERSIFFHSNDKNGPLDYEPSGHDFLSPCLGEADLLRRVMEQEEFSNWLNRFLSTIPHNPEQASEWLSPVKSSDPSDGKLAHFDGLNLSRGWMLFGIASSLPSSDPRKKTLLACAEEHSRVGVEKVVEDMDYMQSHWLGSFAVYLLTCRGL